MATYVVGDIQGCLDCLERLLADVGFRKGRDKLWAVGDLVNRGPHSLETLRFLKGLANSFQTVLGNHDLHLLAVARGDRSASQKDTLDAILSAPDRHDLLEWLRHHPLLVRDGDNLIVHAGIPPQWDAGQARDYAGEVEAVLHSETPGRLFRSMYGNSPDSWHDDLTGDERLRVITNYLTRMRFCDAQGRLDLTHKQGPGNAPPGFAPWYAHSHRGTRDLTIVFGHWAALNGQVHQRGLHALDTGCVWGGRLRLMRLNDGKYWHTSCAPGGHLP